MAHDEVDAARAVDDNKENRCCNDRDDDVLVALFSGVERGNRLVTP